MSRRSVGGLVKVGLLLKTADFTDFGCPRSSFVRNWDLV